MPTAVTKYPVDFSRASTQLAMLANTAKYRSFLRALALVAPNQVVMDVGAGSGILSLLALAVGAKHVIAIEREEVVHFTRAVLARMPAAEKRITVIEGDFFSVGKSGANAQMVVSELIGYMGFEEDIAMVMAQARRIAMAARLVLVPRSIRLSLIPIAFAGDLVATTPRLSLEPLRPLYARPTVATMPYVLGETDFVRHNLRWEYSVEVAQRVDAVAIVCESQLGEESMVSNRISTDWPRCVFPLSEGIEVPGGAVLGIDLELIRGKDEYEGTLSLALNGGTRNQHEWRASDIAGIAREGGSVDEVVQSVTSLLQELGVLGRLSSLI